MSARRWNVQLNSGYTKLLAIFLSITIIPCLLISALAYYVSIDNAKKQAVTYSTQYLNLIVDKNEVILQQSKSILFELMLNFSAYSDILRKDKATAISLQLLQSLEKKKLASEKEIKSFYFVDIRAGKLYASELSAFYDFREFPDQNLVRLLTEPNDTLLFNDLFERETSAGGRVATYVARFPLTGQSLGYLAVDLDLNRFSYPDGERSAKEGHLLIQNQHGQLINTDQAAWFERVSQSPSDYVVIRDHSSETGLSYQYAIPKRLITANNRILLFGIMGICAFFVLLESVAAWFSSKKLYSPLRNLLHYIRQLVGDKESPPQGEDEYYYLRSVITRMNLTNTDYSNAFQANKLLFRQRQLTRLLLGESASAQSLTVPDNLKLQLTKAHYLVLAAELDEIADFQAKYSGLEQELMLYAITNITDEVLSEFGEAASAVLETSRIVALLGFDDHGRLPVYEEIGRRIQASVDEYLKIPLSIGIGKSADRQENIPQAYEQAQRALSAKVYYGKGSILSYAKLPEKPHPERTIVSWGEFRSQLSVQLQTGAWEPVRELLDELIGKMTYPGLTAMDLQLFYLQYTACLFELCNDFSLDIDELFEGEEPFDEKARRIGTVVDLSQEMFRLAQILHERIKSTKEHIHQDLIRNLLAYIREHLDQNLTLESLAEKVYMHPAYLSRICKSLTGKGLGEQIIQARVDKAKELLLTTNKSVTDISLALGYTNPRAFYRLFKEYTGLTPGEFRKSAGLQNTK